MPLILMIFAFVLFVIAGFITQPDPYPWRYRLVCIGWACMAGSFLWPMVQKGF